MGRLNLAGHRHREMCTGTLVAPDLVLTAAHCVTVPADGLPKRQADMIFVAGWDGGTHAGASGIARILVHPEAYASGRFDLSHDLALVQLREPLTPPPLPVAIADPTGPLTLMGYRRRQPHRLTVAADCHGAGRAVWMIDCRVEQGQSGGPVLAGEGTARRVVGVISALRDNAALVVPVDDWVIAQLAKGR
ncbi:trypsin-like serine protease [Ponticoccus alexandrii]|uniref:Trypsin-like serine protease n=1 Tax=Ponticoccus alexandrii TaxID=1943633 RepID=A0ABX7F9Z9_9RHOB|nr:trypsin-like serine protease [Ponticoccus alexandrii]